MSSSLPNRIRLESPLIGYPRGVMLAYHGTVVSERAFLGHINVRGDLVDASFARSAALTIGVDLPSIPNTVHAAGDRGVCWLCPNEWLIICAGDDEHRLAQDLRENLRSCFSSVVELGGGQTVLRLEGSEAGELLARGCPLDLHPRVFSPGHCAQTHVAKAPALLLALQSGIDVVVRRSFADYLWLWLESIVRYERSGGIVDVTKGVTGCEVSNLGRTD